jgi:hypothetical protein
MKPYTNGPAQFLTLVNHSALQKPLCILILFYVMLFLLQIFEIESILFISSVFVNIVLFFD